MNPPPPPPPPPHGESPRSSSGLPPGNYDIFVIPPHSAGSGFLYLPSLRPQMNSFIAGVICTLFVIMVWQFIIPEIHRWIIAVSGGAGGWVLLAAVAAGGWLWGKIQSQGASGPGPGGGSPGRSPGPEPGPGAGGQGTHNSANGGTYQQWNHQSTPSGGSKPAQGTNTGGGATGGWERAREQTRQREKERREKEEAEAARQKVRDREARERKEREERAKKQKEQEDSRRGRSQSPRKSPLSTYASSPGEKTYPYVRNPPMPGSTPTTPQRTTGYETPPNSNTPKQANPPSPTKPRPPSPTKAGEYSFRPYDNPKSPLRKKPSHSSIYSESSYTGTHTRTASSISTPPPSHREPYSTKDPDKIVLKAVYSFDNARIKTPVAQLISGEGRVTDGLILRITTEGLFIDDDVRGVPQREWDIKAWTMKLVEVWCSQYWNSGASIGSSASATSRGSGNPIRRFFGGAGEKPPTSEETDLLLENLLRLCKSKCFEAAETKTKSSGSSQSGDSTRGLHVLRANIRDQEGKRYVFVMAEEEGWKVAIGLQRLRRGTQVRALGVGGIGKQETIALLENLGWTS